MDLYKKYHVSIGSNIGDRLENIQSSLDLIHSRIASLTGIHAYMSLSQLDLMEMISIIFVHLFFLI